MADQAAIALGLSGVPSFSAFAPKGHLRASINLGNPILANHDVDGDPFGVSINLARGLAKRLGVDIELFVFDTAGKSFTAVTAGEADVGFFAVDPLRGEDILFTAPYVLIEGAYAVAYGSPLKANDEVDRAGHRIAMRKGSAYDLYLTREIQAAELVRSPTSPAVVDSYVADGYEVAAGVHQQLEADFCRHSGHRFLPGRFMVNQQTMGLPKSRGDEAADFLRRYVEDMKVSKSPRFF